MQTTQVCFCGLESHQYIFTVSQLVNGANCPSRLKCDRAYPCGNCTRRGDAAACTYVGRGPKGRASHAYTNPTHIQNRIHHLENLVLSFAQKRRLEGQVTPPFQPALSQLEDIRTHANGTHGAAPNAALLRVASNEKNDVVDSPGRIVIEDVGTSYIDAAHWRAILEEVSLQEHHRGLSIQILKSHGTRSMKSRNTFERTMMKYLKIALSNPTSEKQKFLRYCWDWAIP